MQAKSRTLVLLVVSFLLGGIAGVFVDRTWLGHSGPRRASQGTVSKEFTEKLKLRAEQTVAVDSILEAHKEKFGSVRKGYSETMKLQRDTLRREIRKLLNPEQNGLYDQYIKEMEERETRYRKENR
ncbi:MAG: hypothetical protein WEB37_05440 [Bacteroidota bacterium]